MLTLSQNEHSGEARLLTHPDFGTIRIAGTPDQPLFCFLDVVRALDTTQTTVRSKLDPSDTQVLVIHTRGGWQRLSFFNEHGLHQVISRSRNPKAPLLYQWIKNYALPAFQGEPVTTSTTANNENLEGLIVACLKKALNQYLGNPKSTQPIELIDDDFPKQQSYSLKSIADELGVNVYQLELMLYRRQILRRCNKLCDCLPRPRFKSGYFIQPTAYHAVETFHGDIRVTPQGRDLIKSVYKIYGINNEESL